MAKNAGQKGLSNQNANAKGRVEHNFQDHATMMLEELGVEVHEGDNVMSVYQSTLMKENKHNFQGTAMTERRNIASSK